jgi:CheY-like chemotaxis protein
MNRDMLGRRLARAGFDVVFAVDGLEALDMVVSQSPDLVLMDIQLPSLDGAEAIRRIRANPKTNRLPVIALTAYALAGDEEAALAAGADDYDTKPIDFQRLLQKMARFLNAPDQRRL